MELICYRLSRIDVLLALKNRLGIAEKLFEPSPYAFITICIKGGMFDLK